MKPITLTPDQLDAALVVVPAFDLFRFLAFCLVLVELKRWQADMAAAHRLATWPRPRLECTCPACAP